MGRQIDPSWWTHRAISCSSQCSTTAVTKAVVCVMVHIKEPLLLIAHVAVAGFLSRYLSGPLPYVRHHITELNVLSVLLNKKNFLPSKLLQIKKLKRQIFSAADLLSIDPTLLRNQASYVALFIFSSTNDKEGRKCFI